MTTIEFCLLRNCWSLNHIIIPSSVKIIENKAFFACSLIEIEIPSSVYKIGEEAFGFCRSLKRIKIFSHNLIMEKSAFTYCNSLDQIIIHSTLNDQFEEFKGYIEIINFEFSIVPKNL